MLGSRFDGYSREERPLRAYAALIGAFNGLFAGFLWLATRRRRELPERVSLGDVLLLGVATHKLSRLIAKDRVTSVLRAPFAEYQGSASGAEVDEKPRGHGARLAIGELITCPYCLAQWVAACLGYGLMLRPRATRFVMGVFSAVALAELLHRAHEALARQEDAPN